MNMRILVIMFMVYSAYTQAFIVPSTYECIDEVRVVLYNDETSEIITTSDIKPGLEGKPRTLKDIVIERCMVHDAQRLHITVSDEELDRHLGNLQKEQGLNRDMLAGLFKELGYAQYEDGRQAVRERMMIDQIMEYRVRTSALLDINKADAQTFYEKFPAEEKATFSLVQAYIPSYTMNREQIEESMQKGTFPDTITWSDVFTITEDELAQDRLFIKDRAPGSIVDVEYFDDGCEVTKLVAKTAQRIVPFEEKADEVLDLLRRQKFAQAIDDYYARLLKESLLVFTHPQDKQAVFDGIE